MTKEEQVYLDGFAFEARVCALGKEHDMFWTKSGTAIKHLRKDEQLFPGDFTRGQSDGLLSAYGLDGVCSPDCVCREPIGLTAPLLRRYFHDPDHIFEKTQFTLSIDCRPTCKRSHPWTINPNWLRLR